MAAANAPVVRHQHGPSASSSPLSRPLFGPRMRPTRSTAPLRRSPSTWSRPRCTGHCWPFRPASLPASLTPAKLSAFPTPRLSASSTPSAPSMSAPEPSQHGPNHPRHRRHCSSDTTYLCTGATVLTGSPGPFVLPLSHLGSTNKDARSAGPPSCPLLHASAPQLHCSGALWPGPRCRSCRSRTAHSRLAWAPRAAPPPSLPHTPPLSRLA